MKCVLCYVLCLKGELYVILSDKQKLANAVLEAREDVILEV